MKTFTIPTGKQSKITSHLFQGQMPKRVVQGFVEKASLNGEPTKNPFRFKHDNIKMIAISCSGETMTTGPFEPNFHHNQYLRSYLSLYQVLGGDWAHDITLVHTLVCRFHQRSGSTAGEIPSHRNRQPENRSCREYSPDSELRGVS